MTIEAVNKLKRRHRLVSIPLLQQKLKMDHESAKKAIEMMKLDSMSKKTSKNKKCLQTHV